jgi:nucleotide-binding universal stress UspA family protein
LTVPDIIVPGAADRPAPGPAALERAAEINLGRILVPLNGAPSSEFALPFAALIARRLKSEVNLFHSLQPMHPVRVGRPGHVPYPDAQHDRGSLLAASYLEEVAARMRPHGLTARWSVATGDAAQMIVTRAVSGGFGLTVIAGQPRRHVVRKLKPGVVDDVWKRAASPLLLINRARVTLSDPGPGEPESILFVYRDSDTALAALPIASVLAAAFDSRLSLLIEKPESAPAGSSSETLNSAEESAGELRAFGCKVEIERISGGEIAVARRQIHERGSWVVAGSHLRTGLARLFRGSSGDNYLRLCRGPLIVVPDPDVAEKRSRKIRHDSLAAPDTSS